MSIEWKRRGNEIDGHYSDFSERAPLRPQGATEKEGQMYRKVIISYDTKSHFSILFQMYGSVWRYVWPYCLLNMAITYLVDTLRDHYDIDLTIEDSGHMYVSTLVSFLLVTRVKIAYDRFMSSRKCVDDCLRCARSLIQFMNVFSMRDHSKRAKDWRNEVAYRVIILIRVTFAALEFKESGVPAFESSMLRKKTKIRLREMLLLDDTVKGPSGMTYQKSKTHFLSHKLSSIADENSRAPKVTAYWLRMVIAQQKNFLENELPFQKESVLLDYVSNFLTAYSDLEKYFTTPFPFPFVQMGRTLLFVWMFTLPFAITNGIAKSAASMAIMFLLTYGFVGLEYVSMELDDPFGNDANDIDAVFLMSQTTQAIYFLIGDSNGEKYRKNLERSLDRSDEMTNFFADYRKTLLLRNSALRLEEVRW